MSDTQHLLGMLVDGNPERDAVHIAVVAVTAGERLLPGNRIGIVDGVATCHTTKVLGIVDPFLTHMVCEKERCWMFLLPNTITSLKHNWTHPDFDAATAEAPPLVSTTASEKWLRDFCERSDCPDYDTVIAAATGKGEKQWHDDYLHFEGQDAHGEIPPEFWGHVEVVTGKKIKDRATYFSCSC